MLAFNGASVPVGNTAAGARRYVSTSHQSLYGRLEMPSKAKDSTDPSIQRIARPPGQLRSSIISDADRKRRSPLACALAPYIMVRRKKKVADGNNFEAAKTK